jgi:GDPmannose 4,6-dehydratase
VVESIKIIFNQFGNEYQLQFEGENETATVLASTNYIYTMEFGKVVVTVDPEYYRPTEVDLLIGDPTKSKK